MYPTKFDVTEKDFESIWETIKTRAEFKQTKMQFNAVVTDAAEVCDKIVPFSFEEFEKKFFRAKWDALNIIYHYNKTIEALRAYSAIGNTSKLWCTPIAGQVISIFKNKGREHFEVLLC